MSRIKFDAIEVLGIVGQEGVGVRAYRIDLSNERLAAPGRCSDEELVLREGYAPALIRRIIRWKVPMNGA